MPDVNTVRTVFKTEWLGAGVVQNMVRQYGLAQKAMDSMKSGPTKGITAGNVAARQAEMFASKQRALASAVAEGAMTMGEANERLTEYGAGLAKVATEAGVATEASGVFGTGLSATTVALGATAAAIGAVVIAFKTLYPIIEEGANIAQLDQSFQNLNATMTDSPNLLRDMKEASRGTLSTMAAQEGIMTLVAGSSREVTQALADAAPRILEISKAANKLNPQLGTTNFMFTSLAKGLKRAEPRLIDNLGLKLRVSDANREMAENLGKSVMELTAEEKQLAILNETLKAGDKLIAQVGGSVDGLGDSYQRVSAASEDWSNSMKENLALMVDMTGPANAWAAAMQQAADDNAMQGIIRLAEREGLLSDKQVARFFQMRFEGDQSGMEEMIKLVWQIRKNMADSLPIIEEYKQAGEDVARAWLEANTPQPFGPERGPSPLRAAHEAKDAMLAVTEAQRAARDAQNEWSEESKKALEEDAKAATKWADAIEKASREANEAWQEYQRGLITTTSEHIKAEAENSYYTTSIEGIGDAFITVGGATEEQADQVERLTKKLESATEKAADFALGIGAVGMKEEAVAKRTEKYAGEIAVLERALESMNIAETETMAVHQAAVWDWDKIKIAMFEAGNAADLSVEQYARLGIGLGQLTQEQAAAAVQATAMGAQMSAALEKIRLGEISPEDAMAELEKAAMFMRNNPIEVLLKPKYDAEKAFDEMNIHERTQELINREDDKLDIGMSMNEDEMMTMWQERMLALEEEPPIVDVKLELDEAQQAINVFKSENSEMWIKVHIDEWSQDPTARKIGGIPEFAGGGNALANQPIIVGDEGPEIIIPGSNSTVLPQGEGVGGVRLNTSIVVHGSVGVEDLTSVVEDTLMEAMQRVGVV